MRLVQNHRLTRGKLGMGPASGAVPTEFTSVEPMILHYRSAALAPAASVPTEFTSVEPMILHYRSAALAPAGAVPTEFISVEPMILHYRPAAPALGIRPALGAFACPCNMPASLIH